MSNFREITRASNDNRIAHSKYGLDDDPSFVIDSRSISGIRTSGTPCTWKVVAKYLRGMSGSCAGHTSTSITLPPWL